MRELKFRAWDEGLKRYFYDVAVYPNNIVAIQRHNIESMMLEDEYGATHWTELGENTVIEQYTGLKDKNGKEIYEGDILGGIWESGFISWCEKCKQFQYHSAGIGCMACSGDVHWCEIVEDDGKLEVIGNIHENPELLGEEK